jgi:hypothetical protein
MHRSGTSSLAGALVHIGFFPGNKLLPATDYNKKGFYEDRDLIWINNIVLEFNQINWYNYKGEDIKYSSRHFQKLVGLIWFKYGFKKHVVIKDPRISILLPMYISVFKYLDWPFQLIIIKRNPQSIIRSITSRNRDLNLSNISELIDQYYISIDKSSLLVKKLIVHYEDLIDQNQNVFTNLAEFLTINKYDLEKLKGFFDLKLKNY